MKRGIKIKQRDITDCGAACIASVAAYHRLHLPVSRIRQYAGTDSRGTNVLGLVEAAEKLGFQAKAAKGTTESLSKIPLPAIAHVIVKNGLHHFVVICKVTKKHIYIMDPGEGTIRKETITAFAEKWTGIIVLLLPGESFKPGNDKASHVKRFFSLIRPHKTVIAEMLIGALVYTILGLSASVYMQKVIDHVIPEGNMRLLNLLSIGMIIILLLEIFIGSFKTLLGLRTGQHIDASLILGYYKHLLQLPQRFFDTMRVGEIISRINDAVKTRVFVNDVALGIVVNVLIVAFSITLMFFYYWKLALIMLALIPIYALLYALSNAINKKWQRRLMEHSADLEAHLVESLNAAGTIKRFGLEQHANLTTENRFVSLLRTIYQSSTRNIFLGNTSDFFTRLFTIGILWAGTYFVIKRELTAGELLSFYALIGYFTGPALSLIGANRNIQDALIAADRLFEIIDLETEPIQEHAVALTPELIGDIRFNNIHFRYGTRAMVFNGLNLCIRKNQTTAIVGESGSGKSSLLSLLQNLYPLKEGNISIGGIDINHFSHTSLRRMISVVPQQIDLFSGTIIDNIAIGDVQPDLQRLLTVSKITGLHEVVEKLPANYNTILNENGVNLSGGQRQRLAIARALYRNPEILILDEATSNLDPASERTIQEALEWFRQQDKTLIIIAHRLSTIRNADEIIVLKEGKVQEQGQHEQLLQSANLYSHFWAS